MRKNYNVNDWFVWEQHASPMFLVMTLNPSMKEIRDYFGSCVFNSIVVFENDGDNNYLGAWLLRVDEGTSLGQKMVDMLLCPPYRTAFNLGVEVSEKHLVEMANNILALNKTYTLEEIPNIFDEFSKVYYDYYKFGAFTEPVQWYCQSLLSKYLDNHYEGEFDKKEALGLLLAIDEDSFAIDILKSLEDCAKSLDVVLTNNFEINDYFKSQRTTSNSYNNIFEFILNHNSDKNVKTLINKLEFHSKKFHWKKNNYFATSYISAKDVLIELINTQNSKSNNISHYYTNLIEIAENSKAEQLEKKRKILSNTPLYYRNVVSIVNSITELYDKRKKNVMLSNSAFDKLLNIVAQKTNTDLNDIHLLIPQEVSSFIQAPDSYRERFEQRKKLFVVSQFDFTLIDEEIEHINTSSDETILNWKVHPMNEPSIIEGFPAEEALEKINLRTNIFIPEGAESDKLQGVPAFYDENNPIIEGKVRIIKNPDIEILQNGEILIAPSTTPDYITHINNCKAIITDWGGKTSHAAITSRELKKPCIIGTNFASVTLKTGQNIRADFSSGTIEILD